MLKRLSYILTYELFGTPYQAVAFKVSHIIALANSVKSKGALNIKIVLGPKTPKEKYIYE